MMVKEDRGVDLRGRGVGWAGGYSRAKAHEGRSAGFVEGLEVWR